MREGLSELEDEEKAWSVQEKAWPGFLWFPIT